LRAFRLEREGNPVWFVQEPGRINITQNKNRGQGAKIWKIKIKKYKIKKPTGYN
jgi:hypothetical protein